MRLDDDDVDNEDQDNFEKHQVVLIEAANLTKQSKHERRRLRKEVSQSEVHLSERQRRPVAAPGERE